MTTARYLATCVNLTGAVLNYSEHESESENGTEDEPEKGKIYTSCSEFMADVNEIESRANKDGFRIRSSVMTTTTSSYDSSVGRFVKGPPEEIVANVYIVGNLKYFGEISVGEISFRPGRPGGVEVGYLSVTKPINSAYIGLKNEFVEGASASQAYEIFKDKLMPLDQASRLVVPAWCAASLGKDGIKFIQDTDPTKLTDPKYIKREFTAKRANDLMSGKIVVVQYRGKGRTHTSGGRDCLVYPLRAME
jgi:hypothetical protein